MSAELDETGPVDYLLVEFPRGRSSFGSDVAAELLRLSYEGLIRVIDMVIIQKASDGSVEGFEVEDLDLDLDLVGTLEESLADVLSAADVTALAASMEPGTVAGVVVWESLWAAPLGAAVSNTGGRVIASGRVPLGHGARALALDAEGG